MTKFHFFVSVLESFSMVRFFRFHDLQTVVTFKKISSFIQEAKKSFQPPIPANHSILHENLSMHEYFAHIHRGCELAIDGNLCFVFMTKVMAEALRRVTELAGDGTFAIRPREMGFAQVYFIFFHWMDYVTKNP